MNQVRNYRINRYYKKLATLLCITCLVSILLMWGGISTFASSRHSADTLKKYYKSIEIQSGDTLWDIAKIYTSNTEISQQDYVNEVYNINQLTDGKLHQGQHLVVSYYVEE